VEETSNGHSDSSQRDAARRALRSEVFGLTAVIATIMVVYGVTQHRITFNNGHPWDADVYRQIATQFVARHRPAALAPDVYRIGVPWLVSQITPSHLTSGFRIIDITSVVGASVLLWMFFRLYLRHSWSRLILIAVFLTSYIAPFRQGLYIAGLTYSTFLLFLIGGLLTIEWARRRPDVWPLITLAAVMFVGTLVRETMLLLIPVVFCVPASRLRTRLVRTAAAGIPAVAAFEFTHAIAHSTNSYTFAGAARDSLAALTPAGAVTACFITLGAPLILCLAYQGTAIATLKREPHLAALIGVVVVLAALGGTNTEVFLSWAIPAVFVVAGQVVEAHWTDLHVAVVVLLISAQVLLARVLWPIPDFPGGQHATALLTPLGRNVPYIDLATKFAPQSQNAVIAIQCIVLTLVVAADRLRVLPKGPSSVRVSSENGESERPPILEPPSLRAERSLPAR
jgi:hypothetical protein